MAPGSGGLIPRGSSGVYTPVRRGSGLAPRRAPAPRTTGSRDAGSRFRPPRAVVGSQVSFEEEKFGGRLRRGVVLRYAIDGAPPSWHHPGSGPHPRLLRGTATLTVESR